MLSPEALARRLRDVDPARFHVVTLPDFFLDHFIHAPPWAEATARWREVHDRGGGNVPSPNQRLAPGGNAANTALALARLGVRTHLVTRTSPFGKAYLEQTLGRRGVDLHHVHGDGTLAVTTAIEFGGERPHNVMLSDPGSVAEFGPEQLGPNDWTLIEAADLVLVSNWSQNRRGTDLVEAVARAAHKSGRRMMLDSGDPSVRPAAIGELRDRLVPLAELDIFGLNENELQQLSGRAVSEPASQRAAARELHARRASGVLDLHTASFAASYQAKEETVVPTFAVKPLRVTGAGDAWNAGNILGHLAALGTAERLMLANAVAGIYISHEEGLPPTLADVITHLASDPKFSPE